MRTLMSCSSHIKNMGELNYLVITLCSHLPNALSNLTYLLHHPSSPPAASPVHPGSNDLSHMLYIFGKMADIRRNPSNAAPKYSSTPAASNPFAVSENSWGGRAMMTMKATRHGKPSIAIKGPRTMKETRPCSEGPRFKRRGSGGVGSRSRGISAGEVQPSLITYHSQLLCSGWWVFVERCKWNKRRCR